MKTDLITHMDQLEGKTGEIVRIAGREGVRIGVYAGMQENSDSVHPKKSPVLIRPKGDKYVLEICFPSRKGTFPRMEGDLFEGETRGFYSENFYLVQANLEALNRLREQGVRAA